MLQRNVFHRGANFSLCITERVGIFFIIIKIKQINVATEN